MAKKNAKKAANDGSGRADELRWIPATARSLTVRGLAWFEENKGSFSRLPLRAKDIVREPVWNLAQSPSSARVAFRSNTTALSARVTNVDSNFMSHMPATGSNGVFLYCGAPGRMRPWAVAVPDQVEPSFERPLFAGVEKKMREFRLYLPLYKAMLKLELGFSKGARILKPSPPAIEKPVVFYGTSITQGGCASTPGSDFVSTIGRLLNINVVNLGFSGNGKGDMEMAELMSEIDAALYVLDYAANSTPASLKKTLPRFARILRDKHPLAPILLVTNVCYSGFDFDTGRIEALEAKRDIMFSYYVSRRRQGDCNLHLADGYGLIPYGTSCAYVDGVHPTDHGFQMMAERLSPFIEQILMRDA